MNKNAKIQNANNANSTISLVPAKVNRENKVCRNNFRFLFDEDQKLHRDTIMKNISQMNAGMNSAKQQWTDWSGEYGPPKVLVTARTEVR